MDSGDYRYEILPSDFSAFPMEKRGLRHYLNKVNQFNTADLKISLNGKANLPAPLNSALDFLREEKGTPIFSLTAQSPFNSDEMIGLDGAITKLTEFTGERGLRINGICIPKRLNKVDFLEGIEHARRKAIRDSERWAFIVFLRLGLSGLGLHVLETAFNGIC